MTRYDFDQGLPDPALYPVQLLDALFAEVFREHGAGACEYFADRACDMAYGHFGLRDAISEWLNDTESCRVTADHVVLANGSTNGIAMAINTFLGPGDALIVEETTYRYAASYARAAGATVFSIPIGPAGMEVHHLDRVLDEARAADTRPRMIYTIATFHSPTGTVLALDRRESLLETARAAGLLVLDDSCYHHLWYDAPPPPSLLALDDGRTVIQSGSFSKYIAPGLRMAWLASAPEHVAAIAAARQDFAVSQIVARAVELFVRRGHLDAHLDVLRDAYRAKRDIAAAALAEHCGRHVVVDVPKGGLYFWLQVDPSIDFARAMDRARQLGVGFRDGVQFVDGERSTHLRLSVAQSPIDDIEPGIELLGRALAEAV